MFPSNVSWQAATLGERVAHLRRRAAADARHDPGQDEGPSSDPDGLAGWARACALGNMDALVRRLSWDGIELDVARRALAPDAPDDFPTGSWVSAAIELAAEARLAAATLDVSAREADLPPGATDIPFVDAWWPVLRVARRRVGLGVPGCQDWLSEESIAAFEVFLLRELSGTGELALLEDFVARRGDPIAGSAPAARYQAYIRHVFASGYEDLFGAFPVLARHVVLMVDQWVRHIGLLVARLEQDRATLEAAFGMAAGKAARVRPGLSDRHAGGARVACVEFCSGLRLAYKPRDVRLEQTFNALLDWLTQAGVEAVPGSLRVVDRGTHGWVEWVESNDLESPAAAVAYFRSAGALVGLAYVLNATDLHGENLIASSRGPVLIDTEMFLQPSSRPAPDAPVDSCLASGLVSLTVVDKRGETFDLGGLQSSAPRELAVPVRRWINPRSDDIRFVPEYRIHPVLQNDVVANGRRRGPEDFVDDVCAGFASVYRFLESNRLRLLAPGGPLGGFADCRTRVLFRPSDQYASAQYLMAAPRYQRHGVDRSLAIETFHQVFATDVVRPALWPVVYDERHALDSLDIPRVTVPTTATDLESTTGEVSPGFYARSGVEAMRDRLSGLGDDDLARQMDQLRTALGGHDAARTTRSRDTESDLAGDPLRAAAEELGRVILDRSRGAADGSLDWPSSGGRIDLYGGAGGIGLFLAALALATGDVRWHDASERVWRGVERQLGAGDRTERLGACSGEMSVAYAMAVTGWLLDDERRIAGAAELAATLPIEAIDADSVLDVDGGAAGALLVLLAIQDMRPDDRLMARARRCVMRLLGTQIPVGFDCGAWPSGEDQRPRPGFAHGAAGIANALCRYARHADDPGVIAAVREAWRYERRVFADNGDTWPAVRRDGGRVAMAAWCHGAPGIALGRAGSPAAIADPDLPGEIDAAMRLTLSAPPAPLDHLCCGNLGRADIALTVGRQRHVPAWSEFATTLTGAVAARVLTEGRRGTRGRGWYRGAPDPEFFQGMAGMGYQFLRATASTLPSVLAFEAPARRPVAAETR